MQDPQTLVGETLHGTYRIDRLIGRGGMGYVYAGTHLRLAQRIAIKLLSELSLGHDEDSIARFQREARVTAGMRHPHIVEVIDFNVCKKWGPYFVMELLDGESLESRLSRTPCLPLPEVAAILSEVAAALSIAHQQGIVHRDLKPSNIMLCRVGDRTNYIKVLDFGIVKVLGSQSVKTTGSTRLGTTLYMSPEQAGGGAVDWRTDQFALGSIVYEMLTGRPPFQGDSDAGTLYQLETKEPPAMEALRPEVSLAVRSAVARALAKSPDRRFCSVLEFSAAFTLSLGPTEPPCATTLNPASNSAPSRAVEEHATRKSAVAPASVVAPPVAAASPAVSSARPPSTWATRATWATWAAFAILAGVLLAGLGGLLWTSRHRGVDSGAAKSSANQAQRSVVAAEAASRPSAVPRPALSLPSRHEAGIDAGPETTSPRTTAPTPSLAPKPTSKSSAPRVIIQRPLGMKEACQSGNASACMAIGTTFERNKNPELAVAAYLQACNLKLARGCDNLGRIYTSKGDHAAASYPYKEACLLNLSSACAMLGDLFLQGKTGQQDVVQARKYYARSCHLRSGVGCTKLALLYCPGGELPENLAECQRQLAQACLLGHQEGCRRARQIKALPREKDMPGP
jgi:eukaryotic-like serine/threonine-protein kinase